MQAGMSHQSDPETAAPPPHTNHRKAIRDGITQALSRKSETDCDDPRHCFIPRAALYDVIKLSCVEELLQAISTEVEGDGDLQQRVAQQICTSPEGCSCNYAHCTGGRMIFSILLLCAREDLLLLLFSKPTTPICDQVLLPLYSESRHYIYDNLSPKEKEIFLNKQWQVYTPFLAKGDNGRVQADKKFPDEVSLPWATKARIGGGFPGKPSFVERVVIHPCIHNLVSLPWYIRPGDLYTDSL